MKFLQSCKSTFYTMKTIYHEPYGPPYIALEYEYFVGLMGASSHESR